MTDVVKTSPVGAAGSSEESADDELSASKKMLTDPRFLCQRCCQPLKVIEVVYILKEDAMDGETRTLVVHAILVNEVCCLQCCTMLCFACSAALCFALLRSAS